MKRVKLSDADRIEVARLHAAGETINGIARQFGCVKETITRIVVPGYAEKRAAGIREARHLRVGYPQSILPVVKHRASLEDCAARLAEIPPDKRNLSETLMGDPIYERSALARRRGERA